MKADTNRTRHALVSTGENTALLTVTVVGVIPARYLPGRGTVPLREVALATGTVTLRRVGSGLGAHREAWAIDSTVPAQVGVPRERTYPVSVAHAAQYFDPLRFVPAFAGFLIAEQGL